MRSCSSFPDATTIISGDPMVATAIMTVVIVAADTIEAVIAVIMAAATGAVDGVDDTKL